MPAPNPLSQQKLDLKDVFLQAMDAMPLIKEQAPKRVLSGQAAATIANDPKLAGSGLVDFGIGAFNHIKQSLWDVANALTHSMSGRGGDLPGATQMPGAGVAEKTGYVVNAATLGMHNYVKDTFEKSGKSFDRTAVQLGKDLISIDEISEVLTGRDEEGNIIPADKQSQNLATIALTFLPSVKAAGVVKDQLFKNVGPPPPRHIRRKADIAQVAEDPVAALQQDAIHKAETALDPEVVQPDTTTKSLQTAAQRTEELVTEWRKTNPDPLFEGYFQEGPNRDIYRGHARYLDKHFQDLPKDLQEFWIKRPRNLDRETGEWLHPVDGIRGGHVFDLFEEIDQRQIAKAETDIPKISVDKPFPVETPTGVPGILNPEQMKRGADYIAGQQGLDATVAKAAMSPHNMPLLEELADLVDRGEIDPVTGAQTARAFGMDTPEVFESLIHGIDELKKSGSVYGKGLSALSNIAKSANMRRMIRAMEGIASPEDAAKFRALNKSMGPVSLWSNLKDIYTTGLQKPVKIAAVGQIATTTRNATVQGGVGIVQAFEDATADAILAAIGKTREMTGLDPKRPFADYWADAASDGMAFMASVVGGSQKLADFAVPSPAKVGDSFPTPPAHKAVQEKLAKFQDIYDTTDRILNEMPMERARLMASPMGDILFRNVLKHGFKGLKGTDALRTIDNMVDAGGYITLSPNRWQEMANRRFFYTSRLLANVQRIGVGNLDQLEHMLRDPSIKLPNEIQYALSDATDHALKQTFAYNPQHGFGGDFLALYQKVPMLASLTGYFPRFLVNQFRYLTEHSPLHFASLLDPGFRDDLFKAAGGEMRQAEAARLMAKATSGTLMYAAARAVRQGNAHRKYNQVANGEKNERGDEVVINANAYQPFSTYLLVDDFFRAAQQGKLRPDNITNSELAEAITSMRNIESSPVFGFETWLRNSASDDPEAFGKTVKQFWGQTLGMATVPGRIIVDMQAGMGDKEAATLRDTSYDPLWGPAMNNIPGIRNQHPVLHDPFRGGPQTAYHPAERQFSGVTRKPVDPLEQMMIEHGIPTSELVGNYVHPDATALVRKYIGEVLQSPYQDTGLTQSQMIVQTISGMNQTKEFKKLMLKNSFESVKAEALAKAQEDAIKQKRLDLFFEHELRNQPKVFSQPLVNEMREERRKSGLR